MKKSSSISTIGDNACGVWHSWIRRMCVSICLYLSMWVFMASPQVGASNSCVCEVKEREEENKK